MIRAAYVDPGNARGIRTLGLLTLRETKDLISWTVLSKATVLEDYQDFPIQKEMSPDFNVVYAWGGTNTKDLLRGSKVPVVIQADYDFNGVLPNAARVIVPTEHIKSTWPRETVVLEHGIDGKFVPGARDPHLIRERLVVLYCGLLSPMKGTPILLDAVRGLDCELWLVGKSICNVEASQQVKVWGHRPDNLRFYQSADVFAFPSRIEGMSLALMEAMACGLPCVASDIPANIETLQGVGITCELNVEKFRVALEVVLETPSLRKDMSAGSLRVARDRDLKVWAKRFSEILEAACSSS